VRAAQPAYGLCWAAVLLLVTLLPQPLQRLVLVVPTLLVVCWGCRWTLLVLLVRQLCFLQGYMGCCAELCWAWRHFQRLSLGVGLCWCWGVRLSLQPLGRLKPSWTALSWQQTFCVTVEAAFACVSAVLRSLVLQKHQQQQMTQQSRGLSCWKGGQTLAAAAAPCLLSCELLSGWSKQQMQLLLGPRFLAGHLAAKHLWCRVLALPPAASCCELWQPLKRAARHVAGTEHPGMPGSCPSTETLLPAQRLCAVQQLAAAPCLHRAVPPKHQPWHPL